MAINQCEYSPEDYHRFRERLEENLQALTQILSSPSFGLGPASIGAELEVFLVNQLGQPLPISEEVLRGLQDERITLELNRFNLECNTEPTSLAGCPLEFLRNQFEGTLTAVQCAAHAHGARAATIGILPTLTEADLTSEAICDVPRYRALAQSLRARKGAPFVIDIAGQEPLRMQWEHVTLEGANTSLQLHVRVDPSRFSRFYNAVQLATAPALAACGNSPTFLGHQLWEETRVALFKQSVDERPSVPRRSGLPRVCFGTGWVGGGALELFTEAVRAHDPLVPQLHSESPLHTLASGKLPGLWELRLHASTVWRWNRPVYDPSGHLRVEVRALPAGPTVTDMLANLAFVLGLAHELEARGVAESFPFELAHDNFYRAAQSGLSATLHWPDGGEVLALSARELIEKLCVQAQSGLARAGVESRDSAHLLQVFCDRATSGQTGAQWQRLCLQHFERKLSRQLALREMLHRYMEYSASDTPVHSWPAF